GYKRFFRRAALETSDYLKDDCLKIDCTVGVVMSVVDSPRLHSIEVPDSDIGVHFGSLLDRQEGSDVVFDVSGEKFHAHKLVLAARSPVFKSQFYENPNDEENNIIISDMEPKVFRAMLHFIYRDSFIEDDETTKSDSPESSPSGRMAAKLLAAADKYGLERLRLLCEAHLCKDLCVDSVANTLSLADHYHATELKAACLKYVAENLG
ncbi:BTB/POZ and MATH domain-containing protein 4-like, partial [Curcuma longa]